MKVRLDFVTNSSSSSFLIAKKHLSEKQIKAIVMHDLLAPKMGFDIDPYDVWHIDESKNNITGRTHMDNFSMDEFLHRIGVPNKNIRWSEYLSDLAYGNLEEDDDNETWEDLLEDL